MLQRATAFADLGANNPDRVDRNRTTKRLARRRDAPGHAAMLAPSLPWHISTPDPAPRVNFRVRQSEYIKNSRNEISDPVTELMSRRQTDRHRRKGKQFAALPYTEQNGETLVMLVTSRRSCRWVLPKGWAEKNLSGPELAAKEAFEEAGLVGKVAAQSVGSYTYPKRLPGGHLLECKVKVFAMHVEHMLEDWLERHQRERKWFTLPQAAMAVEEGDLVALLLQMATLVTPPPLTAWAGHGPN